MPLTAERLEELLSKLQTEYITKHGTKSWAAAFWPGQTNFDILNGFVKRLSDFKIAMSTSGCNNFAAIQSKIQETSSNYSEYKKLAEGALDDSEGNLLSPVYVAAKNTAEEFRQQLKILQGHARTIENNNPARIVRDLQDQFIARATELYGGNPNAVSQFIERINEKPDDHTFYRGIGLILQEHQKGDYLALKDCNSLLKKDNAPVRIHVSSERK